MKSSFSLIFLLALSVKFLSAASPKEADACMIPEELYNVSKPFHVHNHIFALNRHGKGTFQLVIKRPPNNQREFSVKLLSSSSSNISFEIVFNYMSARVVNFTEMGFVVNTIREPPFDLLRFSATSISLWVSFFSSSANFNDTAFIKVGYGYVHEENVMSVFESSLVSTKEKLRKVDRAAIDSRLVRADLSRHNSDAHITDFPPVLLHSDSITLNNIENNFITSAELPKEGQILFSKVAGANVKISSEDVDAINYSLDQKGCFLNEIISRKKSGLGYIRATFKERFGNSPGHPYVFEIWPKNSHSPIHNHGNTVAIIKVLHGQITSEYFNPLTEQSCESSTAVPYWKEYFVKDQITWMTPDAFQTHRLLNENSTTAAISIQAYAHVDSEKTLEEKFNYISDTFPKDPRLHPFFPKQDAYFSDMMRIVHDELKYKRCKYANGTIPKVAKPRQVSRLERSLLGKL